MAERRTPSLPERIPAFPSGHAGAAFAFFGVPVFARRWYGWWALLIAGTIGWSRIYLNVHQFVRRDGWRLNRNSNGMPGLGDGRILD